MAPERRVLLPTGDRGGEALLHRSEQSVDLRPDELRTGLRSLRDRPGSGPEVA